MSGASFFGPVVDSGDVEAALIAFLEDRIQEQIDYLVRLRDPKGEAWPEGVAPIRCFHITHLAAEKWPEEQLPMLIVHSPGETGKDSPRIEADGSVFRTFGITLGAVSTGVDEAEAKQLARLYSSAARNAIMQNPDLHSELHPDGFAMGLKMGQESNQPITRGVEVERSLMGCWVPYEIDVANTMDVNAGATEPQEDPSVEPPERPRVKPGGGSVQINAI